MMKGYIFKNYAITTACAFVALWQVLFNRRFTLVLKASPKKKVNCLKDFFKKTTIMKI